MLEALTETLESVDLSEGTGTAYHDHEQQQQQHGDGEFETFVLSPELTEPSKYELVDRFIGIRAS